MIESEEMIRWGDDEAGDGSKFGVITEKRIGRGGDLSNVLDRHGSVCRVSVRDRHRTIRIKATVTEDITEDDIPEVGDEFLAPVNGRETRFVCQSSELEIFKEDASVLTISGRTLGMTPAGSRTGVPFVNQ